MPFLLRVELPDVPGSLGRLASAIGDAGGDIEAIEIVEKRHDGTAVDDVLLEMSGGAMPDSVVSAVNLLEGVEVVWISRYAAGGNLFLDLEVVEELTAAPEIAFERLVDMLPVTFRCEWGAWVAPHDKVMRGTEGAPNEIAWHAVDKPVHLDPLDGDDVRCAAPLTGDQIVVIGRRGGPEFLESELARLGHLAALAASISAPG
jgi:ACT domain